MRIKRVFAVLFYILFGQVTCIAQTSELTPPIPTSFRSYNTQSQLALTEDGVICAWRSARAGVAYNQIFIQKTDRHGNRKWEGDGVPVCSYPANQDNYALCSDGYGGIVVVWEDSRFSIDEPKIFAQRINFHGEALWGNDGLQISSSKGAQRKPQIISDKKNGFYVVWEDHRNGVQEVDLFVQHVNLGGKLGYMRSALPIVTVPGLQKNFRIEADERQFLYVIWEDFRNTRYWNLYAQKLDWEGNFYWGTNGLDIFAGVEENHNYPDIAPDGYGGLLFVYQKWSDETNGYDIYRGRINTSGELVYHLSTCHASDNQIYPRIVKRASNAVITWQDRRYGNWDIFGQLFKIKDGYIQWKMNGQPVTISSGDDTGPFLITSVSYNNQIFLWHRKEEGQRRLFAQKLDNFGAPVWNKNGLLIPGDSRSQDEPFAIPDDHGGLWCSWSDQGNADGAPVVIQLINGNGLPLLNKEGVGMGANHDEVFAKMKSPVAIYSRQGDMFVCWQDFRNGAENPDIYMQKVNSAGKVEWRRGGIPVNTADGAQSLPALVDDGVGGVIVIWADARNGDDDIYAQRLNSSGKALWNPDGVAICKAPRGQGQIRAVTDGAEGAVICWVDARDMLTTGFDLYIQRVSFEGEPLWGFNGKAFAKYPGLQTAPSLAPDGNGGAYVVWADSRNGSVANIYRQHLDSYGMDAWKPGGESMITQDQNQRNPVVVESEGLIYVAWEDGRMGDDFEKIYVQRLTPKGYRNWRYTGTPVSSRPGRQSKVQLVTDSQGRLWAAWLDGRSRGGARNLSLYVQCFDAYGQALLTDGGMQVGFGLEENNDYHIAAVGGGLGLTWTFRDVNGNQQIRYQRIDANGQKSEGQFGKTITVEGKHEAPRVICFDKKISINFVSPEKKCYIGWYLEAR